MTLYINDDRMAPILRKGDSVEVNDEETLDNGEMGVFLIGENETVCSVFYHEGDTYVLKPLNAQYEELTFSQFVWQTTCKIVGKIVGILKKLFKANIHTTEATNN